MHVKQTGFVAVLLLLSLAETARAQEANYDSATFDREVAKIKKLGKTALPVYSRTLGQQGSITLAEGKIVAKDGAAMYLAPLGWLVNSSLDLGARAQTYVLVNVGGQGVRVGDVVLRMGEYAVIRDGKLVKVGAGELK